MKRIKEIRLENFSEIEKLFDDVKSFAKAKNTDVYKHVLLVGKETIRKFEDVYGISFPWHDDLSGDLYDLAKCAESPSGAVSTGQCSDGSGKISVCDRYQYECLSKHSCI